MTLNPGRFARPCWRVLTGLAVMFGGLAAAAGGAEPARPPVNVVLVHGILNTGAIFDPLVARLDREGCRCFAPSLRPNTGVSGVHDLARKLSAQIDRRFGSTAPVVMVGFSLGGLVTRDYVQTLAARGRVRGVFLISAPNHGTFWANLCPGGGIRDLALGSPFLRGLNADEAVWKRIPVASYWTPYDLMIVPARSSLWPVGETMRVACPLHPLMPRDRAVMADIAARIGRLRAGGR